MIEINIVVRHPSGIHARPAASLVRLAKSFDSEIKFCLNDTSR